MAFSPQQAALSAVIEQNRPNGVIDQNTLQVRQNVPIDQDVFVLVTFSERIENRLENCTFVQEATRGGIGTWVIRGSGGGCSGALGGEEPPAEPVESGSGTNGGSGPDNPGYSYSYGLVNQADITKIRITWEDGQQQEAGVINSSYLAVRAGTLNPQKIEGLNARGEIAYGIDIPLHPR